MLKIPDEYISKIISMFGQIGEEWLYNISTIIYKYVTKFNLQNLKVHENLSVNLIIYAECEEFGEIVLKIGPPIFNELIYRETKALEEFNGKNACKCYYSNLDDGIRILERLIPGETLNSIENREERIRTFCEFALGLDIEIKCPIKLPTYREILDRSINLSNEQPEKFEPLKELINIANDLYIDIENQNFPKYLLHADLHHDNILTSGNERKAIDPHGFLGERVLETARFMENEIEKQDISRDNIFEVVNLVANYFNEDRETILKVLVIDYVLSTCWDLEMNFDFEHINGDIKNLILILDCLSNISKKKRKKQNSLSK